jgi:heme exporter protein D
VEQERGGQVGDDAGPALAASTWKSSARNGMNKIPMLSDAPAAERVREAEDVRDLQGVREFGQAPGLEVSRSPRRRMAAWAIALICVAVTSISIYVLTNLEMPRMDPVIDFPWFMPMGRYFGFIWLALTISRVGSLYLILRSAPDNKLRRVAIAAYLAQLALHTAVCSSPSDAQPLRRAAVRRRCHDCDLGHGAH